MCSLFFNALLIITHWLLLTPHQLLVLLSLLPELHPSLLPCLSPCMPPQPLSLVLGLACLCLGGGLEGMTWASRWRGVTKTYQREDCTERCIAIGCCGNQTCLHFFQPSSLSARLSFPHPRREAGEERCVCLGGWVRIWVSVCAFKCVCTCVFACTLCAVNILEIQKDETLVALISSKSCPKY